MTEVNFSAEQILAIESCGENLLVAAGAGSGKTTVLVERLIHRLADTNNPGSLQRMLVLTFTNAAAADMRGKIDRALNRLVVENPDNRHLIRELAQLPQASISTIHSFCLDLLRRHYYRIDLDAGFRIARDMEATLMAEEVLERFMEEEYSKENSVVAALADAYGGNRDDRDLLKLIDDLYRFSRSQADSEKWLEQACSAFACRDSLDEYAFMDYLRQWLCSEISYARSCFAEAKQIVLGDNIPQKWLEALNAEIAVMDQLLDDKDDFASFVNKICSCKFAALRLSNKEKDVDKEAARNEFKQKRDRGREAIKQLQKKYAAVDGQRLLEDLHLLAPLIQGLGQLVIGYGRELASEKRQHNLIDFADMEHMALQLLRMEDIAEELRNGFDEVLIDEYQDINAVQEEILRLLQKGDNCFAVGDVKQSIYRFRLAEPELFLGKYLAYGELIGGRRIVLNKNYRSCGNIIDSVNYIFRQLMSVPIAEMEYDDAASLKAGRPEKGSPTEFVLIDVSKDGFAVANDADSPAEINDNGDDNCIPEDDEQNSADIEDISAIQAEARYIGKRITELMVEDDYDYGDIAILLRSVKVKERVFAEELAALGIPVISDNQDSFLDSVEIGLMLSLLKIIDNPQQDMPLAAVLRSPIGGFTADELLEIRVNAPMEAAGKGFYQAVVAYAAMSGELAHRLSDFLRRLNHWRELSRRERISALIWQLWRDSGYYQLVGALSGGARRQANLQALYSQACEYEAKSYAGLYRFIRYLEQAKEKGIELAAAKNIGGLSAVRVMSIHRSKGLEFPVVFVAGLGSRFHTPTDNRDIIWHKELGLGPKIANRGKRIKYPSLAYQAVAARLAAEMTAEELRILYVALTRAREKLILTASIRNLQQSINSWSETAINEQTVLPPAYLKRDKRPVDWLGRVLFRHQDAQILRNNALGFSKQLLGDGIWQIEIISGSSLVDVLNKEQKVDNTLVIPELESDLKQQVVKNLQWQYPWQEVCAYPAKWTVSELLKSAYPLELMAEAAQQLPDLLGEEAPEDAIQKKIEQQKAARRGTVNHLLLEKLDWSQSVTEQVEKLIDQGLLTVADADLADIGRIEKFAASSLGRRMAKAARLEREVAFTYAISAKEKIAIAANDDMLIVQGILDAAFWEDDGWILVDYKTGGRGKTEEQIIAKYQDQLQYYCRAIEQLWRQPVKEINLYMFDWPKTIRVK